MLNPHWYYFLTLDSDLDNISRYVDFDKANFKTFSIEFVRIILAAGSEIDVTSKIFCEKIAPGKLKKEPNINYYREIITNKYPQLSSMKITIPKYQIDLNPWEKWQGNENPLWWRKYNDIKHQRHQMYQEANLENTLNAVAGLFVFAYYLHVKWIPINNLPWPKLLSVDDTYIQGAKFGFSYWTPDGHVLIE